MRSLAFVLGTALTLFSFSAFATDVPPDGYGPAAQSALDTWVGENPGLREAPAGECFFDVGQPSYFCYYITYPATAWSPETTCVQFQMLEVDSLENLCNGHAYVLVENCGAPGTGPAMCDTAALDGLAEWYLTYGE